MELKVIADQVFCKRGEGVIDQWSGHLVESTLEFWLSLEEIEALAERLPQLREHRRQHLNDRKAELIQEIARLEQGLKGLS
jgi:hypothetical protein